MYYVVNNSALVYCLAGRAGYNCISRTHVCSHVRFVYDWLNGFYVHVQLRYGYVETDDDNDDKTGFHNTTQYSSVVDTISRH